MIGERSAWGWWVKEWRKVLELPRQDICDVICEQSEYALRLRVLSPLEELLTPEERSRVRVAMSIAPIRALTEKRVGSAMKQRPTKGMLPFETNAFCSRRHQSTRMTPKATISTRSITWVMRDSGRPATIQPGDLSHA